MWLNIYNYLKLFFQLITNPLNTWNNLAEQKTKKINITAYLCFIFALITLSIIIGYFIHSNEYDLAILTKSILYRCLTLTIHIFISAFFIRICYEYITKNTISNYNSIKYTSLASAGIFAIYIIKPLFADWVLGVEILSLYTLRIVLESSINYIKIEAKNRNRFTILISIIIIACPFLISKLLVKIMPGLIF